MCSILAVTTTSHDVIIYHLLILIVISRLSCDRWAFAYKISFEITPRRLSKNLSLSARERINALAIPGVPIVL